MKKQKAFKKLNLRKNVIGNLMNISGGKPPKSYRYCDSDVCEPSEGGGYSSWCSEYC